MGYGIWDMGYGYGMWDMGYGIWDMGYGIWMATAKEPRPWVSALAARKSQAKGASKLAHSQMCLYNSSMDPMKLSRSVAMGMANDVRDARWKVLRKLTIEEAYFLMVLKDDLELVSDMNWHASLAKRLRSRPEVWVTNMELDEDEEHVVDEMADFEEQAIGHMRELMREPMTMERLKQGEELLLSKGVKINLTNRLQSDGEVHPN